MVNLRTLIDLKLIVRSSFDSSRTKEMHVTVQEAEERRKQLLGTIFLRWKSRHSQSIFLFISERIDNQTESFSSKDCIGEYLIEVLDRLYVIMQSYSLMLLNFAHN